MLYQRLSLKAKSDKIGYWRASKTFDFDMSVFGYCSFEASRGNTIPTRFRDGARVLGIAAKGHAMGSRLSFILMQVRKKYGILKNIIRRKIIQDKHLFAS
jgi:hypothetical protein